ncbi:hypothetical protein SAMN05444377_103134 [Flavobacterium fontis]|uniref:Uncharacterized protein n=1 Tax=Flavobacterium fontis TaxID=1124188 RepID=A0A1M4YL88_9FLAO|nr:hypothetical protein SAMN05444377_103134 [Flavobacterium fontis]
MRDIFATLTQLLPLAILLFLTICIVILFFKVNKYINLKTKYYQSKLDKNKDTQ